MECIALAGKIAKKNEEEMNNKHKKTHKVPLLPSTYKKKQNKKQKSI